MKNSKKNKVFFLSRGEEVLSQYPEYKDQDVFFFGNDYSLMDLVSFKPDFIVDPHKGEVINVSGLL